MSIFITPSVHMVKNAIQKVDLHFRIPIDLKKKCEEALIAEGKGFSEFLRDAVFQKVREYEERIK